MEKELKPCPFCGSSAWWVNRLVDGRITSETPPQEYPLFKIECSNLDCQVRPIIEFNDEQLVLEAWNRRTP